MAGFGELVFDILAYMPETMRLERLSKYLQQIEDVIGATTHMHLVRIEPSRTKPVFHMPVLRAIQARERIAAVPSGNGTPIRRSTYNWVRRIVRRDGRNPASLNDRTGLILDFPPAQEETGAMSGVRQTRTFGGALIGVGGVGNFTPIQMQDLEGEVFPD